MSRPTSLGQTSIVPAIKMIRLNTAVVTNRPAPNIPPKLVQIPSLEFEAYNDDITSGAPFAKANKVTPAKASLKLNFLANDSKDGVRYSSAVDPRSKKHRKSPKKQKGKKYAKFPFKRQKQSSAKSTSSQYYLAKSHF